MSDYRIESDSIGDINVPSQRYWGAQTQRSLENFPIGGQSERMPDQLIRAFGYVKKTAAEVNESAGRLDPAAGRSDQAGC